MDLHGIKALKDLDRFPADSPDDLFLALHLLFILAPKSFIPSNDLSLFIELNGMFPEFRIARIPDQGDPFVHFHYIGVERGGPTDVQVEDPGTGLITYTEEVFEAASRGFSMLSQRE